LCANRWIGYPFLAIGGGWERPAGYCLQHFRGALWCSHCLPGWYIASDELLLFDMKDSMMYLLFFFASLLQESSFQRGVSYVMAMVAEFDEYTNDWLYLREGTILPKYCISLIFLILNVLIYFVILFFMTL
jgi:hypothetical protein